MNEGYKTTAHDEGIIAGIGAVERLLADAKNCIREGGSPLMLLMLSRDKTDDICLLLRNPKLYEALRKKAMNVDIDTKCPDNGTGVEKLVHQKPRWDPDRRMLFVGAVAIKEFKVPAPNQEAIIAAFHEENWPVRIDDPLSPRPDLDPKRRIHDTISSLNRNQEPQLLHFLGDGNGLGIRWQLILNTSGQLETQRKTPDAGSHHEQFAGRKPRFDTRSGELSVGAVLIKQLKGVSDVQRTILSAFQEEAWPVKIDDPLPPVPDIDPKRRLHDAIKSLNRRQEVVRFFGDGTGEGIRWAFRQKSE